MFSFMSSNTNVFLCYDKQSTVFRIKLWADSRYLVGTSYHRITTPWSDNIFVSFFLVETVVHRWSSKSMYLKLLQISKENTYVRVSF